MLSDIRWKQLRTTAADELEQPSPDDVKMILPQQFNDAVVKARKQFPLDDFAEIRDGQLKLKRYDKVEIPPEVPHLQKVIEARLPSIRIEQLLLEVDQQTHFSRYFVPVQGHQAKPAHFYRSLMATIISQATNLSQCNRSHPDQNLRPLIATYPNAIATSESLSVFQSAQANRI